MHCILFEDELTWELLPLTYVRPVTHLRIGVFTLYEKWQLFSPLKPQLLVRDLLQQKYGSKSPSFAYDEVALFINGRFFPTPALLNFCHEYLQNTSYEPLLLIHQGQPLLIKAPIQPLKSLLQSQKVLSIHNIRSLFPQMKVSETDPVAGNDLVSIDTLSDLIRLQPFALEQDFANYLHTVSSNSITDPYTRVYSPEKIWIEPNVKLRCAILNASQGPILIREGAEIQENAVIIGPAVVGEHAVVAAGAVIRPYTTIGPFCKVGGEISHSIFLGFSNKAHDGFLGNSYIAEWCNLGAATTTSNLKNNYEKVKLFNEPQKKLLPTTLQFLGTIMGDYSKTAIHTTLNTGTVVGIATNIVSEGFPPNFIPSFSWFVNHQRTHYHLSKLFHTTQAMMQRRNQQLTSLDKQIIYQAFLHSSDLHQLDKDLAYNETEIFN